MNFGCVIRKKKRKKKKKSSLNLLNISKKGMCQVAKFYKRRLLNLPRKIVCLVDYTDSSASHSPNVSCLC